MGLDTQLTALVFWCIATALHLQTTLSAEEVGVEGSDLWAAVLGLLLFWCLSALIFHVLEYMIALRIVHFEGGMGEAFAQGALAALFCAAEIDRPDEVLAPSHCRSHSRHRDDNFLMHDFPFPLQ